MDALMIKTLLAAGLVTTLGAASTSATAAVFSDFTVDEGSVPFASPITFVADKITGNYAEVISFNANGTFDASLKWQPGQFVADDGTNPVTTQLGSFGTNGYALYALLQSSGTYTTGAGGTTTFAYNPAANSLRLFVDPDQNTVLVAPASGSSPWTTSGNADDYAIAMGGFLAGTGTLDPSLFTCSGGGGSGINCGSFGASTSFTLTQAGGQYFTEPVPFNNLLFQSGQLNNFEPTGTQTINGSADVVFGGAPIGTGAVPEQPISAAASTSAMSAVFSDFQVTEGSVPGASANTFVADKITGNYAEVISFTPVSATTGTFAASLKWQPGQFVADDGTNPVTTQLGSFGTNGYALYALLQSSGTFVSQGGGVTTFSYDPAANSLRLFVDPDQNTVLVAPASGINPWTVSGNTADDYLIGEGGILSGGGTLDPSLATCTGGGSGINCGSFGASASFGLTSNGTPFDGRHYFTLPAPFYDLLFQAGQLNSFEPTGTQTINGSADVVFDRAPIGTVPEPNSAVLLGIALLGLVGVRRIMNLTNHLSIHCRPRRSA
jgi:hypothetical protein